MELNDSPLPDPPHFRYFLPLKEELTNVDRLWVASRHLAPGRLQPRNGLLHIQQASDSDFSDVTTSLSVMCRFDVRGLFVVVMALNRYRVVTSRVVRMRSYIHYM
jgi:hypothetical protein